MQAKAPWTLIYASNLPHAFDAFTDTDESRRVIQQAIAFWKTHLEPVPRPDWKPSEARAIVEAGYWNNPPKSVELLAKWIADNPKDIVAYQQYGRNFYPSFSGLMKQTPLLKKLLNSVETTRGSISVSVKGVFSKSVM